MFKGFGFVPLYQPDKGNPYFRGREVNLRSLQPLGLYAANSIFVGDYLTTAGQNETEDHKMLHDLGFEVESVEEMKASLQR